MGSILGPSAPPATQTPPLVVKPKGDDSARGAASRTARARAAAAAAGKSRFRVDTVSPDLQTSGGQSGLRIPNSGKR